MVSTRIVELAVLIASNTTTLDDYLRSHKLLSPSFDVNGPVNFGIPAEAPEIEQARVAAIEASMELQDLLQGSNTLLRPNVNATSLQAIYKFDIANKVPIHEQISYQRLAELCNLYEPDLRRILRFAMVHHRVFCEPRKGFVAHTAASRRLAEDPKMRDGLGLMFDECWQSMARTVDALEQFKDQEPNQTGFSLAHNTAHSYFDHLANHPDKAKRFAGAMESFTTTVSTKPLYLQNSYPWAALGNGNALVVDVGGSQGHISIALAQAFPNLSFIVQDRPETIAGAESKIPSEVADRVKFMPHDFFTEQPVAGADVYLLRWIFHNWPDTYCIKILQKLIPALKPGAKILINDSLVPEPGTLPLLAEKEARAMDMLMLTLYNAREREHDDWAHLFAQADGRFTFIRAFKPEGSAAGIIEAVWDG